MKAPSIFLLLAIFAFAGPLAGCMERTEEPAAQEGTEEEEQQEESGGSGYY